MAEIVGWIGALATVAGVIVAIHYGRKQTKPPAGTKKAQKNREAQYRKLALDACDIIDLANLPEDDRHIATRNLDLRRLYVALRLRLEIRAGEEPDDKTLAALEGRRAPRWGEAGWRDDEEKDRVSLGERLGEAGRLVVLGDPGAGKSTLLRWLATAYLLRLEDDPDFKDLPDIASLPQPKEAIPGSAAFQAASLKNSDKMSALPAGGWLPILVRCRDLPPEADTLEAMLLHTLKKSQLPEAQCQELGELLRARLEAGAALLLVDGLDEITEPAARARFSEQLVRIHLAYPAAPMVVTSRIVGYREMGYRIRSFEHLTVADLSFEDKDAFARRWCNLTERPERREAAAAELIRDIHSADRIERLTGNPMLLTTMALIKRKIGRLPQRRVDLYEKAVEVLLNWRSQVDEPLDPREALPQLEYLAHAMCADGIQQIREDEILERLREMRAAYPNIYPMQQHTPEAFLHLLEARTGLLIQSGHTPHNGLSTPVYEFRHLTFQEYLAGLALVRGHYRGWAKGRTLAEIVAPLAGQVGEIETPLGKDTAVVENWREALRLCVAACNDSEVEEVLVAILRPLPGETGTERARAVLAGLCLADEPNVSEQLAREVLRALAAQVGGDDGKRINTSLDESAMALTRSRWMEPLGECLLDEFLRRDTEQGDPLVWLYGMVRETQIPLDEGEFSHWLTEQAARLAVCEEREAAGIACTVLNLAYQGRDCQTPGLLDGLIRRLSGGAALAHGTAWALMWMNTERDGKRTWHPNSSQREQLITAAARPDCDGEARHWLNHILENERAAESVDALSA
uniref:NACHT domain-containing protein n=1 Tax=Candidatus Kentrum sp. LPFa TaxID=2126335 RepID=A0A450VZP7_9GAMM|nr:MAG: NACHT domain-containing protein [Candidatus Kentron sp. LPFa]